MTKRNHSAASQKAWRTRKLMKQARARADSAYAKEYETLVLKAKRRSYQQLLPCPDYGSRK